MLNELLLPEMELAAKIYVVNHQKIMIDSDLSILYEIPTKRINEQVKRNSERFPRDFMFQLTGTQWDELRSQIATTNLEMRRNLPYAFTEHDVLMLSSVLTSQRAIQVNIQLVRVVSKMRDLLLYNEKILGELKKTKSRVDHQDMKVDGLVEYLQRFLREGNRSNKNNLGYQIEKKRKSC